MAQTRIDEEGRKVALRISLEKMEYLHMRRRRRVRSDGLTVNGNYYKRVSFKYLGCTITDTNQREDEIDIRIQNALRCSAALHKILTSKLISRSTKIRVYKTVIRPILVYGCEAWTLTLKEENKLLVAERKIFRRILGPIRREVGSWRVRKNLEVEELVGEPNIIGESKAARLRWLGHVERMGEDPAHTPHHRSGPLPDYGVKAINLPLRKHRGGAAVSRQPEQHPTRIIILDAQGAVCTLRV
ncbi:uncharacterized protein LOC134740914 [Cydia strobilella]|uniref:uncharacterized protein LOC134740914 n=1 Tax=Cydia strobilella TaxID=1100964 RepID=UPI0030052883